MADAQHHMIFPGTNMARTTLGNSNFLLDQTTDQMEWIFRADEAATITKLGYRYGARTGTPPTYIISLQGVDGSGNPDGTIKGGGSPASKTFTPPADASIDGLTQYQTLANSYTCTRGEELAIVIAYSSGTVNGSNNSSFTATDGNAMSSLGNEGLPYAIQNDAGVRTRQVGHACFAYGSASKIYGAPLQTFTTYTLTSGSTPDEVAVAFVMPTGWTGTYTVEGCLVFCNLTAAKTVKMQLYSGTTILQTTTLDSDIFEAAGGSRLGRFMFQDTNLTALVPGATYRIGFQPQDAAGNQLFYSFTQAAAADWQAYPFGTNLWVSTRTDAGAWSDDTTSRLEVCVLLKDITAPSPQIITAT